MRRAERLFQIVQLVRGRRLSTALFLAERLQVSARTVYRDVADLQTQGVPIEGEAGVGYRMRAGSGEVVLVLPVAARLVHGGGVLCGQALMAAADTAMILAVASKLGGFKPMTTVQLQTSFLRPVAGDGGEAQVNARVLRLGRNLVFGEIHITNAQGELAAHATTTYALI